MGLSDGAEQELLVPRFSLVAGVLLSARRAESLRAGGLGHRFAARYSDADGGLQGGGTGPLDAGRDDAACGRLVGPARRQAENGRQGRLYLFLYPVPLRRESRSRQRRAAADDPLAQPDQHRLRAVLCRILSYAEVGADGQCVGQCPFGEQPGRPRSGRGAARGYDPARL